MTPIDFRNETYASLRGRLKALREKVWLIWTAYEIRRGAAGATTQGVCDWAADGARARGEPPISILTFRPRCTELYQIGALACIEEEHPDREPESEPGTGAHYRLRSSAEWEAWANARREAATSRQLLMPLSA